MKQTLLLLLLFAVLIYLLPLAALFVPAEGLPAAAPASSAPASSEPEPAPSGASPADTVVSPFASDPASASDPAQAGASAQAGDPAQADAAAQAAVPEEAPLRILDERTGEVVEVSVRDFVRGAVAAEMPLTYPDEALRAQAVASHSYALAVKATADPNDPALRGAYFRADPDRRLGYVTEAVMHAMWGEQYEANAARLDAVVDPVLHEVLLYEGAPALACYHAVSNGHTEAAEAVWGGSVPYLVSVDSALDLTCPEYEQSFTLTKQELAQALPECALSGDGAGWIGETQRTAAGYVQTVTVGGTPLSGTAVRRALGLRSADFTIEWTPEHVFRITTRGYGHGVGLSQYGANVMALTGSTCAEILAHYYPGTVLGAPPV